MWAYSDILTYLPTIKIPFPIYVVQNINYSIPGQYIIVKSNIIKQKLKKIWEAMPH